MKDIYLWLIILVVLVSIIKAFKPNIKGYIGESRVNNILRKLPEEYVILKDILIENNNGTTQIDHIVVCPKGIFVIETKNYDGWIYGSDNQKYWTQVIYKTKSKFYNPVWQNRGHIAAIKNKLLAFNKSIPIFSIVAFGGDCKLKKIQCDTAVMYIGRIKKYIKNFDGIDFLDKNDINTIVNILNNANITDKNRRKEHVRYVRSKS